MEIQFLDEAAAYISDRDAIRFHAVQEGSLIECFASRASLISAGADPTSDIVQLVRFFEAHRPSFSQAAEKKMQQRPGLVMLLKAGDVAPMRLAPAGR